MGRISDEAALALAEKLVKDGPLPENAARDAIHIAVATVHGMEILLTWNCRHIANAVLRKDIRFIIHSNGYECPIICTPQELTGG